MSLLLVLALATAAPAATPVTTGPALDLASVWAEACLWEVGANTDKVPAARKALIAEGTRALEFLIPAKLDTLDTLITRALDVVITGIGQSAVPALERCIDSDNANVRRNAADLLGSLGSVASAPAITKLLTDADTQLGALAALGKLKAEAAVPAVAEVMVGTAPERVRYTAALTLGQIGGDQATAALIAELASPAAPLRFAAQYALENLKAVAPLRGRLSDPDRRVRLHAIAALGHIADDSVRPDLAVLLGDDDAIVRGFAIEALGTMLDDSVRARLTRLVTTETNPFALGKARAVLALH